MSPRRIFLCFIALQRLFWKYPAIVAELLRRFEDPAHCFEADAEQWQRRFPEGDRVRAHLHTFSDWKRCEQDADYCERNGISAAYVGHVAYPPLLQHLYDAPLLLIRGCVDPLSSDRLHIAIVGARRSGDHGRSMAFELARDLARRGVVVVSGMAYGIDAAAHAGALAGGGRTIAVWGTSIDCLYPQEHAPLAERICASGAVVSEAPLGTTSAPWLFPRRNRIISGMCHAVVVVEASKHSGSLITARYALEQGREVMAVPGLARSPAACGCNALIRDGAALVESAEDVLAQLSPDVSVGHTSLTRPCTTANISEHRAIDTFTLEEFCVERQLTVTQASALLTDMLLSGEIREVSGKRYAWIRADAKKLG